MSRGFYGVKERKLDYKGRLGVPEELLTASGLEWRRAVAIKDSSDLLGADGQRSQFISIFDIDTWQLYLELAHRDLDADEVRLFMVRVVGDASTVDVDTSNRITLPDRLLQYAKIERQAAAQVVGAIDHFEVWSPPTLESHLDALEKEEVRVLSIADVARKRLGEVS